MIPWISNIKTRNICNGAMMRVNNVITHTPPGSTYYEANISDITRTYRIKQLPLKGFIFQDKLLKGTLSKDGFRKKST